MTDYQSAIESPPRYQWESNSGSAWESQSNNCGPASVTKIAAFYTNNNLLGIENTRRLVTACCVPTNVLQQTQMLTKRGVPALSGWMNSLQQLDETVGWDGTRPIVVGIEMSRVPAGVRDHPFLGWHAVVVLCRAKRVFNGVEVEGYLVNDPNFSPAGGYRPDPDKGKKFYSRSVMQYAYIQGYPRWAVIPNKKKDVFVDSVVTGDPALERKRFTLEMGNSVVAIAHKPFRTGASVNSPVFKRFSTRRTLKLLGRIRREDLDAASKPYGPCWVGPLYRSDGKHILVYLMDADVVEGSYNG